MAMAVARQSDGRLIPNKPLKSRRSGGAAASLGALAAVSLWAAPALSAPPQIQVPTEEQLQPGETPSTVEGPDFISGLARTNFLLGNMGGLRPFLGKYGISL